MPSLTYVMISMSASDMSNGVNGTGIFDEGASPGRVAGGQQPAPSRYPATAAQGKEEMVSRGEQGVDGMLF